MMQRVRILKKDIIEYVILRIETACVECLKLAPTEQSNRFNHDLVLWAMNASCEPMKRKIVFVHRVAVPFGGHTDDAEIYWELEYIINKNPANVS